MLTRSRHLAGVAAALTMLLAALSAPAGADKSGKAGPPTDYRKVKGLSQPDFKKTVQEDLRVEMEDGTTLYVEVTYPDPKAYGKRGWPTIMEVSPYHGTLADREGTRIFPDPKDPSDNSLLGLTGYFAPRGYAVVMVDLRGTGKSDGCLDHLGPKDASDLKEIIEWAHKQKWSNGRVGLTGHSYVGSTPSIAAAQKPKGLVTIAPSAGLVSMYYHQFQYGVPYYLQWVGPMAAYEQLALERDLPPPAGNGEHFPDKPEQTGCGLPNSSASAGPGQLYGQYDPWHAVRDHEKGATKADIPIFMIHGVNDNAARIPAAEWFFGRRFDHKGDKIWLGQWDHGSAGNTTCSQGHPNCRFQQWQYALHAWFDKQLAQRDVDTGPPVEVFLNNTQVWTANSWSKPEAFETLYPDATEDDMGPRPGEPSSVSFTSTPQGATSNQGSVEFVSDPLKKDALFVGLPKAKLSASLLTSQALNLVVTIYSENKDGDRSPMTFCAIQPLLRDDLTTPSPIVPAEKMNLDPQCFTMAHLVEKGDRIVYVVSTSSRHHASTFTTEGQVTVFTGKGESSIKMPLVKNPTLYRDVPIPSPLVS